MKKLITLVSVGLSILSTQFIHSSLTRSSLTTTRRLSPYALSAWSSYISPTTSSPEDSKDVSTETQKSPYKIDKNYTNQGTQNFITPPSTSKNQPTLPKIDIQKIIDNTLLESESDKYESEIFDADEVMDAMAKEESAAQKNPTSYTTYNLMFPKNPFMQQSRSFSTQSDKSRYIPFNPKSDNPYDILNIPTTSTKEEIKAAYQKLVKQYHPDLNPKNKEEATEALKKINSAFEKLSKTQSTPQDFSSYSSSTQSYSSSTQSYSSSAQYDPYHEPRDYSGSDEEYYRKASERVKRERNAKANNPRTLLEALQYSSEERIIQFIKENPSININKRANGASLNYLANRTYKLNLKGVKALIRAGANIEMTDMHPEANKEFYSGTPLILACKINALSIFEYTTDDTKYKLILEFLKAGAQVNATDYNGDTPLHVIIKSGFEVPEWLKANKYFVSGYFTSFEEYQDIITRFIQHGADVNHKNNQGLTPLDYLKTYFYGMAIGSEGLASGSYDKIFNLLKNAGAIYNPDINYSGINADGW